MKYRIDKSKLLTVGAIVITAATMLLYQGPARWVGFLGGPILVSTLYLPLHVVRNGLDSTADNERKFDRYLPVFWFAASHVAAVCCAIVLTLTKH